MYGKQSRKSLKEVGSYGSLSEKRRSRRNRVHQRRRDAHLEKSRQNVIPITEKEKLTEKIKSDSTFIHTLIESIKKGEKVPQNLELIKKVSMVPEGIPVIVKNNFVLYCANAFNQLDNVQKFVLCTQILANICNSIDYVDVVCKSVPVSLICKTIAETSNVGVGSYAARLLACIANTSTKHMTFIHNARGDEVVMKFLNRFRDEINKTAMWALATLCSFNKIPFNKRRGSIQLAMQHLKTRKGIDLKIECLVVLYRAVYQSREVWKTIVENKVLQAVTPYLTHPNMNARYVAILIMQEMCSGPAIFTQHVLNCGVIDVLKSQLKSTNNAEHIKQVLFTFANIACIPKTASVLFSSGILNIVYDNYSKYVSKCKDEALVLMVTLARTIPEDLFIQMLKGKFLSICVNALNVETLVDSAVSGCEAIFNGKTVGKTAKAVNLAKVVFEKLGGVTNLEFIIKNQFGVTNPMLTTRVQQILTFHFKHSDSLDEETEEDTGTLFDDSTTLDFNDPIDDNTYDF